MIFDDMPTIIDRPTVIPCVGTKPKVIEEFAGRANSGHSQVSVARMVSPEGWAEPGQRPEFEEITVVLQGHAARRVRRRLARRRRGSGGRRASERVGPVQHARERRRRIRRDLHARLFAGYGAQGFLAATPKAKGPRPTRQTHVPRHLVLRSPQDLRRSRRRGRHRSRGAARQLLRLPRAERRRQVHDDQVPDRSAASDRRARFRFWTWIPSPIPSASSAGSASCPKISRCSIG